MAKFVRAWESADLDTLVALLTDDVFVSMPPMPFEYEGREVVARFCASCSAPADGSTWCRPAPTVSRRSEPTSAHRRHRPRIGLIVLTLSGDRICAMTRFENTVLPWFGLPRSLPSR